MRHPLIGIHCVALLSCSAAESAPQSSAPQASTPVAVSSDWPTRKGPTEVPREAIAGECTKGDCWASPSGFRFLHPKPVGHTLQSVVAIRPGEAMAVGASASMVRLRRDGMTRITIPGVRTPGQALDEIAGGDSSQGTGIELQRFRFESIVRGEADELLVLIEPRAVGRYFSGEWETVSPRGDARLGDMMFGGPGGVFALPPIMTLGTRRLWEQREATLRPGPALPKDATPYTGFARNSAVWVGADRGQVLVSRNGADFTAEKLEPPLKNSVEVIWVSKDESSGLLFGSSGEAYERRKGAWVEMPRLRTFQGDYAGSVRAIWAPPDESELWIVGPHVMRKRDDTWQTLPAPLSKVPYSHGSSERYQAIDGTSSSDVWVVGRAGGAYHYDGKTWASVAENETDHPFPSVVALEGNRWLTVSEDGLVVEGDGAAITKRTRIEGTSVRPIMKAGDGSVLLEVGAKLLQRKGDGWAEVRTAKYAFGADAAASPKELVSVGMEGRLEVERSGRSAKLPPVKDVDLEVAAFAGRDLWVAGEGAIFRGTLDGVRKVHSKEGDEFNAIAVGSADNVWFVGTGDEGGALALHWDGKRFTRHDSFQHHTMYGAAIDPKGGVYVVGSWGALAHYDGTKWKNLDSGTNESLHSVLVTAGGTVVATGNGGTIIAR